MILVRLSLYVYEVRVLILERRLGGVWTRAGILREAVASLVQPSPVRPRQHEYPRTSDRNRGKVDGHDGQPHLRQAFEEEVWIDPRKFMAKVSRDDVAALGFAWCTRTGSSCREIVSYRVSYISDFAPEAEYGTFDVLHRASSTGLGCSSSQWWR